MGFGESRWGNSGDAATAAEPSDALWRDCPVGAFRDGVGGFLLEEDFSQFGNMIPASATAGVADLCTTTIGRYVGKAGAYTSFEVDTTDATPGVLAVDSVGGQIKMLLTATTDNLELGLQAGRGVGILDHTVGGTGKDLWFEAGFIPVGITAATSPNLFVGFGAVGTLVTDIIFTDADAIASAATSKFIGFFQRNGTPTLLDFAYANGTTPVIVAGVATLVAGTAIKCGWYFNAKRQTLTYFVNGVAIATLTIGSTANPTAGFPNTVKGHWTSLIKNGATAGAAGSTQHKWWKIGQRLGSV